MRNSWVRWDGERRCRRAAIDAPEALPFPGTRISADSSTAVSRATRDAPARAQAESIAHGWMLVARPIPAPRANDKALE